MATMAMRRTAASPLRRQESRAGVIFILPWLISLLVFTTYPVLATFYLSFTEYSIILEKVVQARFLLIVQQLVLEQSLDAPS